jgi:hypothetical protein
MGTRAGSRCRPCSCAYSGWRRLTVAYHTGVTPASSRTRRLSSLLTSSITRAGTRCRNTSSLSAAAASPSTRHARSRASSRCPIREDVIGSGPPPAGSRAQAELQLPGRDPPLRRTLQLCLTVRRLQVLDLPRPTPRDPHDSHRRRTRRGPHCPHVRHQTIPPAAPRAQVQPIRTANPKVSATRLPRTRYQGCHHPRRRQKPVRRSFRQRTRARLKLSGRHQTTSRTCDTGNAPYSGTLTRRRVGPFSRSDPVASRPRPRVFIPF